MSHETEYISLANSLANVPADQWNALAGDHPTVRHEYLHGLEINQCVAADTGWDPVHVLLYRDNVLTGAMPLYLKSHSRGEFVFDHAWAHAYHRHGIPYYPKLICAIPFTPVPGPRLLAHNDDDKRKLLHTAISIADRNQLSSLHVLFPHDTDLKILTDAALMTRANVQFHWNNQNYAAMDDFLQQLNQKNRKKIRQSRKKLSEADVSFQWLEGTDIDDKTLDFFYRCYCQTYLEHGNPPYLLRDFFYHLRKAVPESMTLILAKQNNIPVASALNLRSANRLYGRYWGSLSFIPDLHFEVCYMQGIEYCIARDISVFEGGAQGEHKLARGMLPVRTHSAHWIRDSRFAQAIDDFLKREDSAIEEYVGDLERHTPFRQQT